MSQLTPISTQIAEIVSANVLEVEAGGTRGNGDAGHGGRTYLRIKDQVSTYWRVRVRTERGEDVVIDGPREIEIWLGGDTEQDTFVEALRFAAEAIEGRSFPPVTRAERDVSW